MNSPAIVIHTLVPSLDRDDLAAPIHSNIDYQITDEAKICKKNKEGSPPTDCPTIHVGFSCKARGGSLTEAQYQVGLGLLLEIATHYNIPLTRNSILSHHELDTQHPHSCPGPFFPWARLMMDLQSPYPLISIYQEGSPIVIGYLKMGTTYAPVRKVAEALGYTVRCDSLQNRIELERRL